MFNIFFCTFVKLLIYVCAIFFVILTTTVTKYTQKISINYSNSIVKNQIINTIKAAIDNNKKTEKSHIGVHSPSWWRVTSKTVSTFLLALIVASWRFVIRLGLLSWIWILRFIWNKFAILIKNTLWIII